MAEDVEEETAPAARAPVRTGRGAAQADACAPAPGGRVCGQAGALALGAGAGTAQAGALGTGGRARYGCGRGGRDRRGRGRARARRAVGADARAREGAAPVGGHHTLVGRIRAGAHTADPPRGSEQCERARILVGAMPAGIFNHLDRKVF